MECLTSSRQAGVHLEGGGNLGSVLNSLGAHLRGLPMWSCPAAVVGYGVRPIVVPITGKGIA